MILVSSLLYITSASLICLFIYKRQTSFVAIQIASALLAIDGDRGSVSISHRYALKTSNIGIMLLGPAESLTAFIAIYKTISLSTCLSFSLSLMILYACHSGV